MRKRLFMIITLMCTVVMAQNVFSKQIIVSGDGPVKTLQQAIDTADRHDTITLQEGRFLERNVIINKPLIIEGKGDVIIDAEGKGYVLIVRSDSVAIRNLQVHHAGTSFIEDYAGILIEKSNHVLIEDVKLTENFFGIYLAETSDAIIRNNLVQSSAERESSSGNGIHLWYSRDITIENNTVRGHRDGIYFEFVESSIIKGNHSEQNLRYGLHFMFSDRCSYSDNLFVNNGAGVAVMFTDDVDMTNNTFKDNWGSAAYGLLLKEIYDSKIENNQFINNSTGMYIEASNRLSIKRNNFIKNGYAVSLMANSMDNRFMRNNFIQNSFDVSTNSRQNFNIFRNNYWSQYEGYDLDHDGTGDVPYHPVRLFSIMVEKQPELLVLMRSLLIGILDTAERIMPVLTPEELVDIKPQMARIQ